MRIGQLTFKAVELQKDHEGFLYVYNANLYYKGKKVGTYQESYMCGPPEIDILPSVEDEIKDMCIKFFDKYPYGIEEGKYNYYSLKDLYKNDPIEGVCTTLSNLYELEKDAKKAFKKGYKYYITFKDKGSEKIFCCASEKDYNDFLSKGYQIMFTAIKGENSFDIEV